MMTKRLSAACQLGRGFVHRFAIFRSAKYISLVAATNGHFPAEPIFGDLEGRFSCRDQVAKVILSGQRAYDLRQNKTGDSED